MNLGYSFIWPKGEDPYFLLPNGSICPLVTKGDVPYLHPGTPQRQPKASKKTRCVACICQEVPLPLCGECTIKRPGQLATTDTKSSGKECKDVKTSVASTAAPADVPDLQPVGDEQVTVDIERIVTEEEADRFLPEGTRSSLREEAVSLFHQLRHKPKNPYCDTCRRSKLMLMRKLTGSFKHDATHWGQHVTGDHMVTLDELGKGLDGGVDGFVIMDIYSGLRGAYPAPDKSAESTTIAIRTFVGTRPIHKLYADRSGEISRALKNLNIMPQCSQPGVPQTNAVAERANGDILAGTRSLLLAAGLPHYF